MMWRLAILLLPWQTRWFADASFAGWPWEQGRLSFYASWIPMLVFIVWSFCHSRENGNPGIIQNIPNEQPRLGSFRQPADRRNDRRRMFVLAGCFIALIVVSILNILRDHAALRPILQWWAQIAILALFVFALWKANVSKRSIATWFVISLVPQAMLGVWQFASQAVIGNKWVGIATQLPQTLGVSVIAHDGLRILRAYAGFPHPNIFGGWLAVGLLVAMWLAATSDERRARWAWIATVSLFASVLVVTFSRGAWLAAAIGVMTFFIPLLTKEGRGEVPTDRPTGTPSSSPPVRGRIWIFLFPFILLALVILSQRQHVFVRFDLTQRLEQKSVDQRVGSLRMGLNLFLKHPLIGTGPNAELLSVALANEKLSAPLEPPHNAFLLALDDVGIVGIITIVGLFLVGAYGCTPFDRKAHIHAPLRSLVVALFVLALFDHYLWSIWSGQALVAMAILLIVEPKTDP